MNMWLFLLKFKIRLQKVKFKKLLSFYRLWREWCETFEKEVKKRLERDIKENRK